MMRKVEFYRHNLSAADKAACQKVLNSLFLSTGQVVSEFEEAFARYLNVKHAVGVTSCTDALFLALRCLGVGAGDEVITTPLSFVATANAIEYTGARPVFVDVEADTGNIDVAAVEKAITKRTKAIIAVHLYGQMCDMKQLRSIADAHALKIVEDCAHCIEGSRDGVTPGALGDIACFSFYATKNLTSGEGGALATNNTDYYEWLRKARLHGLSKNAIERYSKKYEHYDMEFLGYKANMNNIQASLLINQLERLDQFLERKERIAQMYDAGFAQSSGIRTPAVLPRSKHARHLYTIWVNKEKRDSYLHELQENGIGVAVNFRPIHLMHYYQERYGYRRGDFPVAEFIGDATITLPFYPRLGMDEVRYVVKTVNSAVSA